MSAEGPRRLLEQADELNGLLRGALEAERGDDVDEARLARIGRALAVVTASAAPASLPSASSAPPAAASAARSTAWLAAKAPYVLLGAALVGGLVAIERMDPPVPAADPPVPTTLAPTPMIEPPPAAATPTLAPADLPSAPVIAPPTPGKRARATASAAAAETDEVALVARAHDALRSDPARSLALCKEHETRFPGGHFAQEREAVAIEALVYLRRSDEATRRWTEFQRRYPSSSHRVHLESLFAAQAAP